MSRALASRRSDCWPSQVSIPARSSTLRYRALQAQAKFRQSEVRGFLGGRLELIPHQFYILQEVAGRARVPARVLLADRESVSGKRSRPVSSSSACSRWAKRSACSSSCPRPSRTSGFSRIAAALQPLVQHLRQSPVASPARRSDPAQEPVSSPRSRSRSAAVPFLAADNPSSRPPPPQAVARARWDIVVVDEAHHLAWSPEVVSAEYALVEQLARRCPGSSSPTATPTQLGFAGRFARLRLLDPHRYDDFARFQAEAERFGTVAAIAEKIVDQKPLKPKNHTTLRKIFNRDPARLGEHLDALAQAKPGAREGLLRTLLDQHGTRAGGFSEYARGHDGISQAQILPGAAHRGEQPDAARPHRAGVDRRRSRHRRQHSLRVQKKTRASSGWWISSRSSALRRFC